MVPGAVAGSCICPEGTSLVDGKCVKQESCKPPLVMIPAVGCMCPDGTELVNGKCVKNIVCKPPLIPNASGTDCVCRDGLVLRRGRCVEREKPKREKSCKRGYVWNGDMCVKRKIERDDEEPRERPRFDLPGGFGGRGGGSRDGGGGGSPGRR